ncbi:hypothetical protein [uncultured Methylobacterium sp.]|jgi:hypothetical protein|uniref:hypothetical protein n=1 Tax=uncultured Methylobacterium sp. TaxID=157278 RepID=UPI002618693A|nr:hypothetical protein [uncultured Methylobacterium sp.]
MRERNWFSVDVLVYPKPDPVRVYRLAMFERYDAVCDTWPSRTREALKAIANEGRAIVVGKPGWTRFTPDEIERIVESVWRLGSQMDAARELGVSLSRVQRGVQASGRGPAPRLSARERGRSGALSRHGKEQSPCA